VPAESVTPRATRSTPFSVKPEVAHAEHSSATTSHARPKLTAPPQQCAAHAHGDAPSTSSPRSRRHHQRHGAHAQGDTTKAAPHTRGDTTNDAPYPRGDTTNDAPRGHGEVVSARSERHREIAPDASGQTYNINADTMAGAIAAALGASRLFLLTDVAGVLDKSGELLTDLDPVRIEALRADGTVTGGMIPKLETCIAAVEAGVDAAVILDGRVPHVMLVEIFTARGAGTLVHKAA
jgi:hypothetical protein